MKHYIAICIVGVLLMACDPASMFTRCDYYYPIQAINLRDSIKTTDTIWIDTKLPAQLCLQESIYKNGKGTEHPLSYKLKANSFESYSVEFIGLPTYSFQNDSYITQYGIVFHEPGIYILDGFHCLLENDKDNSIFIQGYFDVESNNSDLYAKGIEIPISDVGYANHYYAFVVKVIE